MASRIAFGSCNNQALTNRLWPVIEARSPTAFVWGGDAIYADQHTPLDWSRFPPVSHTECATPERLRALYRHQRFVPGYRQLVEGNATIFGTLDDHDFGCNNGDSTYPYRYESGLAFMDFLEEPTLSPMRLRVQQGLGVYGVKLFDFNRPEGNREVPASEACIDPDACTAQRPQPPTDASKTVAVFVLDVRTNKTPWATGVAAFQPDYDGDFLGERQWKWFEEALRRSDAAVNVIVNGLQVHASRFPNANIAESWDKLPRSRQRLYEAVLQENVKAPILISGDVHMTQLMRRDCVKAGVDDAVHPLIELTTSGMTHSWGTASNAPLFEGNSHQLTWGKRYQRFLAATLMSSMHAACPWTELMKSDAKDAAQGTFVNGGSEGAKQGLQFSLEKNFGELEFDWEERLVFVRSIGEAGKPLLSASFSMDQLSGQAALGESTIYKDTKLRLVGQAELQKLPESEWICVNHRGSVTTLDHMIGHIHSAFLTVTVVSVPFILVATLVYLAYRRSPVQAKNQCSTTRSRRASIPLGASLSTCT